MYFFFADGTPPLPPDDVSLVGTTNTTITVTWTRTNEVAQMNSQYYVYSTGTSVASVYTSMCCRCRLCATWVANRVYCVHSAQLRVAFNPLTTGLCPQAIQAKTRYFAPILGHENSFLGQSADLVGDRAVVKGLVCENRKNKK